MDPLPLTGLLRFALQATVLLCDLENQIEKVKELMPTWWKPQENVPFGETRTLFEEFSTERDDPLQKRLLLVVAVHEFGENAIVSSKINANLVCISDIFLVMY